MPKKIDITQVVKLEESNYPRWKLQISLVLEAAELWDIVNGDTACPAADPYKAAWKKKDVEARALIVPTLGKSQTNHIYNCATSKDMFDRLKDVNSDSSALNNQHILNKFLGFKIAPNQNVISAFLEVEELARNLNEMGVVIDTQTVITKIVSSLPESYGGFKDAWDSVPEATQTMPLLLSRLRKKELEKKHAEKPGKLDSSKAMAFSSNARPSGKNTRESIDEQKKKTNCNNCGKKGHWARECRGLKKTSSNSNNSLSTHAQGKLNAYAAFSCDSSNKYNLISDSGATQHITGIKDWLEDYKEYVSPRSVSLTDQNSAKVSVDIPSERFKCIANMLLFCKQLGQ